MLRSPNCHPEHIRYAQCKLREGSRYWNNETLRVASLENLS